jgi:hypothetical protein
MTGGKRIQPDGRSCMTHAGIISPYGKRTAPCVKMPLPYVKTVPTHGEVRAPHVGLASPYGERMAPYDETILTHGPVNAPHDKIIPPHGKTQVTGAKSPKRWGERVDIRVISSLLVDDSRSAFRLPPFGIFYSLGTRESRESIARRRRNGICYLSDTPLPPSTFSSRHYLVAE